MNSLKITLINCFGIGTFNHTFDLSKGHVIMIYAPNGTMKTSFARSLLSFENKHNPEDLIDETKKSSYSFILDGNRLTNNQVYVYKTEDNQIEPNGIRHVEENNILSFVSDFQIIEKYNEILKPIEGLFLKIGERFKSYSKIKRPLEDEFLKVFKAKGVLAKYDSLYKAFEEFKIFNFNNCDFSNVCYSDIFDDHETSLKYIRNNIDILLTPIGNIRKQVKIDNYNRWDRLCEIVDTNLYIRKKICDLESLRKDLLLYFVKQEKELIFQFCTLYNSKLNQLQKIVEIVDKDKEAWNKIRSTFSNRFHVPYMLEISNKAEAVLNKSLLHINYLYRDSNGIIQYKSKEHFLNFISTGEKRAYYLLLNLFEIEKRKERKGPQIIVIDDIAESFDYRNKYAIIEYLADLQDCKNFILIILTHNFDFYRTIHSRLDVSNIFIANKDKERNILLQDGSYVRDIIKNKLIKNIGNPKYLIALIPFVRNIVEYTKGNKSKDYIELTAYLHVKSETKSLTMGDLMRIITDNIYLSHKTFISNANKKYIDCLFYEAEEVQKSDNIIAVENKLVLSMALRIIVESYMKGYLDGKIDEYQDIRSNQTKFLFEKYQQYYPHKEKECEIIRKVLMLTSENIHINNFMFEPIIDLSLDELKVLYNEVKSLKKLL